MACSGNNGEWYRKIKPAIVGGGEKRSKQVVCVVSANPIPATKCFSGTIEGDRPSEPRKMPTNAKKHPNFALYRNTEIPIYYTAYIPAKPCSRHISLRNTTKAIFSKQTTALPLPRGAPSVPATSRSMTIKRRMKSAAVAKAIAALQTATAMAPAGVKDNELSDSEEDDAQPLPLFVQKLKAMMDDSKIDSAVWSTDGETILIRDPARLAKQLPKYFKASKLNSFVRQLHFYGFKKVSGKRNCDWAYNHKYFQASGHLIHKVRRKTSGPDRQIQNLTLQVEGLQTALADTQRKLASVASALINVLKERAQQGPLSLKDVKQPESAPKSKPVKREMKQEPSVRHVVKRRLPEPLRTDVLTSSEKLSDSYVAVKRPRSFGPAFDFDSPFSQFEMLSPRLLSPRSFHMVPEGNFGGFSGGNSAPSSSASDVKVDDILSRSGA